MMEAFIKDTEHIYIACGRTDFRKQMETLSAMVINKFNLDPYEGSSVFIFCNKKRNAIKVLRFEDNSFILAHKKLIEPKTALKKYKISKENMAFKYDLKHRTWTVHK